MSDYRHKREHSRLPIHIDVRVTQVGTETAGELIFETADLSAGGAFLRSDLLLETGDECDIAFELPNDGKTLNVRARVAWTTRQSVETRGAGMGVEFTQLLEEDEQRLIGFLEKTK
ncbi:MAG: PilZ domain-containing protein [Myxococcota bacterium]